MKLRHILEQTKREYFDGLESLKCYPRHIKPIWSKVNFEIIEGSGEIKWKLYFLYNEKWEKKGKYYDVIGWKERLMSNSGKQLGPDLGESVDRRI